MKPLRAGRITASDRASAGVYEDLSGPEIERHVAALFGPRALEWERVILPDEIPLLSGALVEFVDDRDCQLVITTGGTGPAPRDVMPEATRAVLERELPGFGEIMRVRTFDLVPTSILSRATAGVRRGCLIVNLPGRPAAVGECLAVVGEAIKKALAILETEYVP
jgi:molybdopterin adenylyltransferase